ncbi:MAG: hypothetical protein WAM94_11965 [Chromatiaceae bacterium]
MKSILIAALFVVSTVALAGGDSNRTGAPGDNWQGTSNTDETQRSLIVKCPVDTLPTAVSSEPDVQGQVIVVECTYTETE